MLPLTVGAVFLNFLTFVYLTESFVLLTANVEDIKLIAKKFLSESITDQISDFISKAKLQDVSGENQKEERRERENFDADETYRFEKPDETFSYHPRDNEGSAQFNPTWQERREKSKHEIRYNDDRPPLKIDSTYFKPNDDFEEHRGLRIQVKTKNVPRMASLHPSYRGNRKNRVTTERYRNEFDQYDNTNYDRNELVATSGHLGLSRVKGFNNRMSKNQ